MWQHIYANQTVFLISTKRTVVFYYFVKPASSVFWFEIVILSTIDSIVSAIYGSNHFAYVTNKPINVTSVLLWWQL